MQIGLIGLGKMGYNIALNLRNHGHSVIAHDRSEALTSKIAAESGISSANSVAELIAALAPLRVIWLMVPAGPIVDEVIESLLPHLSQGDILIDGGNSNFNDSVRRHKYLKTNGIEFLDCGTSGGTSGALKGACTMIGGEQAVYDYCKPIFDDLSLSGGTRYVGGPGAGHFVKMVHNGIEYGMMQAIAEGFEVLEKSAYDFDFQQIAELWNHGSVVRSWLMELSAHAFQKDPDLSAIRGVMHASGEGKWTLETALDLGVPTPVIALSLLMRYRSQQDDSFAGKVVAALRNEFGGHSVVKSNED
ncbi:MAG: decarboxylating 6-phosphogluconate dehydrogenase [Phycisphaerae bacterium]|nr:decarboxylating 6-phosphogluconate dehydrogenase [Saprospiraceae bacterium]